MTILKYLLVLFVYVGGFESHSISEELLIEPLSNSFVQFYFQFQNKWLNNSHSEFVNYDLFPKRIGDLAAKFDIQEMSLSLSQGTWKHGEWSMPVKGAPTGSELYIAFNDELSQEAVHEKWLHGSRAVSGLFGLSINLEDNPITVEPKYSIKPDVSATKSKRNVRYASIPNEIVCTENLTPWLKLLPCGKHKGLAQLFKSSPKLFESHYFMTSLHFKSVCMDTNCNNRQLELKQTLTLVYNIDHFTRQLDDTQLTWSLKNIFANNIDSHCPVAELSNIYLNLPNDGKANVEPTDSFNSQMTNTRINVFDLKKLVTDSKEFDLIISRKNSKNEAQSFLSMHRYITDKNERNFGLKTIIRNELQQKLSIIYMETIPWYFRVYASSLKIRNEKNPNSLIEPEAIHFVPGMDRKRPHQIEIKMNLEAMSEYSIYFKCEFAYLKWDEFPPDVNHGFYINPAVVTVTTTDAALKSSNKYRCLNEFSTILENLKQASNANKKTNIKIYSETLLMNTPVPDFSMPYNVICLICTVVAIGFGSIHNFTTRKFAFLDKLTLKEKLRKLFRKK